MKQFQKDALKKVTEILAENKIAGVLVFGLDDDEHRYINILTNMSNRDAEEVLEVAMNIMKEQKFPPIFKNHEYQC